MSEILTRQRTTTFLTHLLCITILFILPEVLTTLSSPTHPLRVWVYAKAVIYIIVFYANYCWIIEKSLDKPHRVLRFVAYNFLLIIIAMTLIYLIWRFKAYLGGRPPKINNPHPTEGFYIARWVGIMSRDLVMIILVIGLATAMRLGDKWLMLDRKQKDLISAQHEEELKSLKSQLNPHFLFNTLNSIYALIAISPEKAQEAVHELSRLLRFILYDSPTSVALKQEFDFITNYISLMRLRLNPSIRLDVRLTNESNREIRVAPLLFITLIENVFKHGIHTPEVPLQIHITATDGRIECFTSNGRLPDEKKLPLNVSSGSGGIGMANLRRRLMLIYGSAAELKVSVTDTLYQVRLTIPPTIK